MNQKKVNIIIIFSLCIEEEIEILIHGRETGDVQLP
jgi:hypothetical protein